MSMSMSVRLSPEDKALFQNYAKMHGLSMSELVRRAVLERIEDDYDLKILEAYEAERRAGNVRTRPIEELWKELDL